MGAILLASNVYWNNVGFPDWRLWCQLKTRLNTVDMNASIYTPSKKLCNWVRMHFIFMRQYKISCSKVITLHFSAPAFICTHYIIYTVHALSRNITHCSNLIIIVIFFKCNLCDTLHCTNTLSHSFQQIYYMFKPPWRSKKSYFTIWTSRNASLIKDKLQKSTWFWLKGGKWGYAKLRIYTCMFLPSNPHISTKLNHSSSCLFLFSGHTSLEVIQQYILAIGSIATIGVWPQRATSPHLQTGAHTGWPAHWVTVLSVCWWLGRRMRPCTSLTLPHLRCYTPRCLTWRQDQPGSWRSPQWRQLRMRRGGGTAVRMTGCSLHPPLHRLGVR